ncbi:MAG TPA: pantetheine-phosphate adenylyltransferase, partial [Algoriphagus sp.]|nr:pantetheine-phosphate adenylyltransferase [Algoriphagus sp.]
MSKVAIFPGSFDPYTKGHHDIVIRSLDIFDEVIIGIGYNSTKKNRYFDIDLMVEKIESVYVDMPNVKVIVYNELTSTLAKKHGANFLIRGLRNTT